MQSCFEAIFLNQTGSEYMKNTICEIDVVSQRDNENEPLGLSRYKRRLSCIETGPWLKHVDSNPV